MSPPEYDPHPDAVTDARGGPRPDEPVAGARSFRRWFLIIFGGILLMAILLAGFAALRFEPAQRALLAERLAELRAAGEPLRYADLDEPLPPDAENAAVLYRRAFAALRKVAPWEDYGLTGDVVADDAPLDSESSTSLRRLVADAAGVVEAVRAASELPECRFLARTEIDPATDVSPLVDLRRIAKLVKADGRLAIEDGDAERFVADVRALVALERATGDGRLIIEYLIGVALRAMTIGLLQEAMERETFDPATWTALADVVERGWDDPRRLERHLVGERCYGLSALLVPEALLTGEGERPTAATAADILAIMANRRHRSDPAA